MGENVSLKLKHWIHFNYKIVKSYVKIYTLNSFLQRKLIPPHLSNIVESLGISITHLRGIKKLERLGFYFQMKVLRVEIFDTYRVLQNFQKTSLSLSRDLSNLLPASIWNAICNYHWDSFDNCFNRLIFKADKRIHWQFIKHQNNILKHIKPITYYCTTGRDGNTNEFSLNNMDVGETFNITIHPNNFQPKPNPIELANDSWFINTTKTVIPRDVVGLLQFGDRFSLPFDGNKNKLIFEFIKDIESNIIKCNENERLEIRNHIVPKLNDFIENEFSYSSFDKKLLQLYKFNTKFQKDNPDLLFTRADKGNITVVMSKENYIDKMNVVLQDTDTYIEIKKDPIKKIESDLNNILKTFLNKEYITRQQYYFLRSSDKSLPKAYGLPKIHKDGFPLRIIVSTINSPLYSIANFVNKILTRSFPSARSHTKNSFELYKSLSNFRIKEADVLLSLDVVSMFTNIPVDLALLGINNRWSYIEKFTDIPKDDFIYIVRFILSSTYFTFNDKIFKQTFGTPMGSPLSPIIADIVLQDIENKARYRLGNEITLFYRYVDDIFLIASRDSIDSIVHIFNSFHDRIKFTFEIEKNRQINFLDLKICVERDLLILDWYHKDTFSGRYLSFFSNHPICHKIGSVYSMVDRALLLSHPSFHQKNLTFCIDVLINNGYPIDFLFKHINNRIKHLLHTKLKPDFARVGNNEPGKDSKFISVPYIKGLTEYVCKSFKNSSFSVGYKCLNRLNRLIKVQKDITPPIKSNNIVYKISCNDCNASYVGQTKRRLGTRVGEHINNIKQHNSKLSVISQHRIEKSHQFKWDDVEILDTESNYHKRLISEMIYIKTQENSLNIMEDTESLNSMYFPLIKKLAS